MINVRDEKYLRALGKSLRSHRLRKGITQEVLAENCGIGKNQVGLIERGQVNLTVCTLKVLSKQLNVSIKEILDF